MWRVVVKYPGVFRRNSCRKELHCRVFGQDTFNLRCRLLICANREEASLQIRDDVSHCDAARETGEKHKVHKNARQLKQDLESVCLLLPWLHPSSLALQAQPWRYPLGLRGGTLSLYSYVAVRSYQGCNLTLA